MGKTGWLFVALLLSIAAPFGNTAVGAVCAPAATWSLRQNTPSNVVRPWGVYFPANGRFYLMGGRTADSAAADLTHPLEYNPATNDWRTMAGTFASNQVNNMVGGVLSVGRASYIYVVGGSAAGLTTASATVQRYDPVEDAFTTITLDPWPGAVDGITLPGGAAVFNNKLYVFGGFRVNVGMTRDIYQFDPNAAAGSRWTKKASVLPAYRSYIPAATAGARIYLLGGTNYDNVPILADSADAFSYDPVGDKIALLASVPRAVGETRAIAQRDGTLWVLGGGRSSPNPSNEVDVYHPGSNTWTTAPSLVYARRNFGADVDPATGNIFVAGGYDTDGVTLMSMTERYCGDTVFGNGFER